MHQEVVLAALYKIYSFRLNPIFFYTYAVFALQVIIITMGFIMFLGPRGPLVLPLVACTPARKKNLDHNIYRHTCLMNHQKTRLTSLMAPWDPLDALLDPLAPPGPPMNPLGPLNRSLGLIQTQDHLVCITNHQRTHQMSLPILWNILPFPLDPLGPCRPTP